MKTAALIGIVVTIICVSLLTGGFLFGHTLANQQDTSTPISEPTSNDAPVSATNFPEYLVLTDVKYSEGSSGWLSVTVNNTGISNVEIAKLMLNNVKQSTNLSPLLPVILEPDHGIILNATMDIMPKECQIDVLTSNGNMFSKTAFCSSFLLPFIGSSSVTVTNILFNEGNPRTITLTLKNTGTQSVTITTVKVNNQIATNLSLNLQINPDAYATLTLSSSSVDWVNGNTYKIDLYDNVNNIVGAVQQNAPGA